MSASYVVPDLVLRELRDRNVPWEIKPGGQHGKLIVNGVFCGILSCGRGRDSDARFAHNLRSQVRRAIQK